MVDRHVQVDEDDSDNSDINSDQSESDVENALPSIFTRKEPALDEHHKLIVETGFDAYFTHASSRSQTSSNSFSTLVAPLTAEEYSVAYRDASATQPPLVRSAILSEPFRSTVFSRCSRELEEGFNLIFYGYGSKRQILNQFAIGHCSKAGHVIVAYGFQPNFNIKDMINSIENVPGILSLPLTSSTLENQTRRIYDFFLSPAQKQHLYLIIHNIDATPLRTSKAKSCLSLLALNPHIHLIASVDHLNAPLLWSSSDLSTRKRKQNSKETAPPRGFAWLWHDMTTLVPYDFELSHADRSSITGAHGGGTRRQGGPLPQNGIGAAMTETAALHILASVTQKAQKLFVMMATKQLESAEEMGAAANNNLQELAIGYDMLFNLARDDFIAPNDTALRSLLGEFRDHGLVLAAQAGAGGGEVMWIPLRKERLAKVLHSIQSTDS